MAERVGHKNAGRHGPKVKSGCKTCKRRKVKCDEAKPACARCLQADLTCEGYGIWGGGRSARERKEKQTVIPYHAVPTFNPLSQPPKLVQESLPTIEFEHDHEQETAPQPATTVSSRSLPQVVSGNTMNKSDAKPTRSEKSHFYDNKWPSLRIVPKTRPCFLDNPEQRTLFDWYLSVTSWKLPGTFTSAFWTTLLPQASHSEPAILYGVLALAGAHRTAALLPPEPQALKDEQLIIHSYNKAMQYLCSQHLNTTHVRNAKSMNVTLIACILFICLEMVQRRFKAAAVHLSSGARLLRQSEEGGSAQEESDIGTTRLIEQTLLKLSLQVNPFETQSRSIFSSREQDFAQVPIMFYSVEEAREHLDAFQIKIAALRGRLSRECVTRATQEKQSFDLDDERDAIREHLRKWLASYSASRFESNPLLPERNKAATIVLRMSYQIAVISTEVCQIPQSETLYDEHTTRFLCIVDDATKLWSAVRSSHQQRPRGAPHFLRDTNAMVLDIGYIPAAYFVAIKCRVREIRLRAIYLLEHTDHTEGAWDASVCARVAREVMSLEEGSKHALIESEENSYGGREPQTVEDTKPSNILESQRLNNVEIILAEDRDVVLGFRYSKMEGNELRRIDHVVDQNT